MQGLEFVLTPRDCTPNQEGRCVFLETVLIDEVVITMDVPVGTRRPEQTYRGNAGLAQFTVSYSVRCAVDHYGADCTRECTNFVSCEGCGLPGFFGEFCQFPADNCDEDYCNSNGECEDGSLTCDCEDGYEGDRCEVDIDECEGITCSGNGRCEDRVNSFECMCEDGYEGDQCEINIDECEGENCNGNGRCEDGVNSFECICEPGYTGDRCEVNINECEGVNCSSNGRCEDGVNSFECICNSGFTGETCDNTDFCFNFNVNCSGNGDCMNFPDRFVCVCEGGYTGDLCDIQCKSKSSNPEQISFCS